MATIPVTPSPAASAPSSSVSQPPATFHLPSYLLGMTSALILLGIAFFFWPRSQPAAVQLHIPSVSATTPQAAPTPLELATPGPVVIFVSGAVAQPGLYTLAATARIGDAIAAAGGLLPGVDGALVNQAQPIFDGAQLHIPPPTAAATPGPLPAGDAVGDEIEVQGAAAITVQHPSTALTPAPLSAQPPVGLSAASAAALPMPTATAPDTVSAAVRAAPVDLQTSGSLINVNTATSAELESLPAIGPAKAQAIITNRPYATVDELDRVPGIGPATLDQIRPLVTTQ